MIPFSDKANAAAAAILACMRQDLDYSATVCDRAGIADLPYPASAPFRILMDEWRAGRGYDYVILCRRLAALGADKNGASPDNLRPLLYIDQPLATLPEHVEAIQQATAARALHELGKELVAQSLDVTRDAGELLELARTQLATIDLVPKSNLPPWVDAFDLIAERPELPAELVAGCLHRASKLVLGGSSKSNKTWSLIDLAISVATGSDWWGMPTIKGRVLYLNLEIAAPFFSRRLDVVMQAKGVVVSNKDMTVWNLRGHCCDISVLADQILPAIKRGDFSLIILDPIYKCLGDRDENKAGEIASLLNQIERIAVQSNAAVAFGAHYSKGNQSAKESIDRIGGSGVFARDPDAILTLTKHEEDECFTCEPVLRNHAPIQPFVVRWEYPLMRRDESLDPALLKQAKGGRKATYSEQTVVDVLREMKEATTTEWQRKCSEETGMSNRAFYSYKDKAFRAGMIFKSKVSENWLPK